uniref:Leucine rich immune protein (Coil-less) n=1 Tax=Anopheles epiroticus TaxID=199890 RepID=A0A182P8Y7_9DIPT
MVNLLRLILMLVVYVVACHATVNHRCLSGSEMFVCILPSFDYTPGQSIPLFDLPADVQAIRFIHPFSNTHGSDNNILMYDRILHRQLNSPRAIELSGAYLTAIEVPSDLEYADFFSNDLKEVHVPANQSYALRYLDLSLNNRIILPQGLENVSRLVNLETLHLSSCSIEVLPPNMFENLNRLAHLTLAGNGLHQIDLNKLPISLSLLRLDVNAIAKLSLPGNARLPLLEDLNLEYNELTELNVSALVETAPKLRLFSLGRNLLKRPVLNDILDELNRRNIAYYNMETYDKLCGDHEVYYRGVCMSEEFFLISWTDWLGLVLLFVGLVALVGGVAFGGYKLWKRYPNINFGLRSNSS